MIKTEFFVLNKRELDIKAIKMIFISLDEVLRI